MAILSYKLFPKSFFPRDLIITKLFMIQVHNLNFLYYIATLMTNKNFFKKN